MRELLKAQSENMQEQTSAQKMEIQALNGKVDSLDQKMGMLVELFTESLKLQKQ